MLKEASMKDVTKELIRRERGATLRKDIALFYELERDICEISTKDYTNVTSAASSYAVAIRRMGLGEELCVRVVNKRAYLIRKSKMPKKIGGR